MKISCTPISMIETFKRREMDLEKFINFCAEQEIDGVDIMDSIRYPWQWKNKDKELRSISGWVEKAGLKIAAYACGNDFTKRDDTEFYQQVNIVKNALHEAEIIGAPLIRIFGGKHPCCGGKLPHHVALERIIQGIEICLPEAEKHRVVLALENHGCLPGHSYEIEKIIKRFNSPFMKCMFDCANFQANNMDEVEDTLVAYERLKKHIIHVHFKDFRKAVVNTDRCVEACVAGQGVIPLRQFSALLANNGYNGYCSLEYEAGAFVPEQEGVSQSLKYMLEIIAVQKILS